MSGEFAVRGRLQRISPGAACVNVRLKFANQRHGVGFVEHENVVNAGKSGHEDGAGAFGEDRATLAFQFPDGGVGVDGDDEKISFAAGGAEVTDVTGVEKIEDAVGKDNFAAGAAVFLEHFMQTGAGKDFFACVHSELRPGEKVSYGGDGGKPGGFVSFVLVQTRS